MPVRRPKKKKKKGNRLLRRLSLTTIVLAALLLAATGKAAAGPLDPSFGKDGVSLVEPPPGRTGESAAALTADARGRLIVAGATERKNVLVRRYLANGTPDPNFDGNGRVETSLELESEAHAVTVLPGGDILVAGGTEVSFALIRYHEDGSQALSFGRQGHVTTRAGTSGAAALALGVQAGGRILGGGYKIGASNAWTGMLIGYRGDGSIDRRFDGDGRVEVHSSPATEVAVSGVKALPSGKILIGGDVGGWLMLGRLHADGSPDRSFGGGDGIALFDVDDEPRCACSTATSMTIAPGGRPVLSGYVSVPRGESALLARFTPDGRLDPRFGRRGVVRAQRGSGLAFNDVAARPDGRLIVAGLYDQVGRASQAAVLRYLPSGKLDRGFAHGGFFHRQFGLGSAASAVITRPDGRTVVAGSAVFPAERTPGGESSLRGSRVLLMKFRP